MVILGCGRHIQGRPGSAEGRANASKTGGGGKAKEALAWLSCTKRSSSSTPSPRRRASARSAPRSAAARAGAAASSAQSAARRDAASRSVKAATCLWGAGRAVVDGTGEPRGGRAHACGGFGNPTHTHTQYTLTPARFKLQRAPTPLSSSHLCDLLLQRHQKRLLELRHRRARERPDAAARGGGGAAAGAAGARRAREVDVDGVAAAAAGERGADLRFDGVARVQVLRARASHMSTATRCTRLSAPSDPQLRSNSNAMPSAAPPCPCGVVCCPPPTQRDQAAQRAPPRAAPSTAHSLRNAPPTRGAAAQAGSCRTSSARVRLAVGLVPGLGCCLPGAGGVSVLTGARASAAAGTAAAVAAYRARGAARCAPRAALLNYESQRPMPCAIRIVCNTLFRMRLPGKKI